MIFGLQFRNERKIYLLFLFSLSCNMLTAKYGEDDVDAFIDDLEINTTVIQEPIIPRCSNPFCSEATPQYVAELLCSAGETFDLFKKLYPNFYNRTNPINAVRSLLDIPSLQPYYFYNECFLFTVQPFYNLMPKAYYTQDGFGLSSYLNFRNDGVFSLIQTILDEGCAVDKCKTDNVLNLFKNVKLMQHRIGAIFGIEKEIEGVNISLRAPLYYFLNHFYLTPSEISAIQNNPFFVNNALSPEGLTKATQFGVKHLVKDVAGFGDSRLTLVGKVKDEERLEIWLGLQGTLPTASVFGTNMLNSFFEDNNCEIPNLEDLNCGELDTTCIAKPLDIYTVASLCICKTCPGDSTGLIKAFNPAVQRYVTNYLINVLDTTANALIAPDLGNGGHFGVGPQIDVKININECWISHFEFIYEYLFAGLEDRYILLAKDASLYLRNLTELQCLPHETINFANLAINSTFLPSKLNVNVVPGGIVKMRQYFLYDKKNFHSTFGLDFWFQSGEILKFTEAKLQGIYQERFANRSNAYQIKLFGDIGYFKDANLPGTTWYGLFTFDGTIFKRGIGNDVTLGVRFGVEF